jgi:glutathione peroxidase
MELSLQNIFKLKGGNKMKKSVTLVVICLLALKISAQNQLSFYDYSAKTIMGDTISLSQFKGKKLLVVNTASFCGYTPQFKQLEELYQQYKSYNFEIIGFPCNDFGSQEPQTDSLINQYCTKNYDVTFHMMSKIAIVKGDTAPVYKWLQKAKLNGVQTVHVDWNFNKFLIDEEGHWVRHFSSPTLPTDTSITNWILKPVVTTTMISAYTKTNELIALKSANPSGSSMELIVKGSSAKQIYIRLYTLEGRLIDTIYIGNAVNSQLINYSAPSLPKGIYLIKAESNGIKQTIRYTLATR